VTLLRNSIAFAGLVGAVGGSALAYEVRTVDGGGMIEGVVRFNGAVETRTIVPTKDMAICGAPREEPVIRVGADKAVESAVVYLVGVEGGKAWPAAAAPRLNQESCRFHPEVQVIPAGPLEVMNSDPVLHNTQGFYGRRSAFNIALPNQGQVIPVELQRPGTVRIDCDAHGWMEGWIYVVDNPYHATTGADGAFSITDVPPGEYTLVAVQPSTGPVETKVTVIAGQATKLDIELKKK
jgi:hypothetical protein